MYNNLEAMWRQNEHFLKKKEVDAFSQEFDLRCGSCHIPSVLIGVKYYYFLRILDVYLLFAILLGQIKSKLNYRLVTYKWASP